MSVAGVTHHDDQEKPDAWLFGTWFSSGQFPKQWALEELESLVEITSLPEPDHAVAKQLAKRCARRLAAIQTVA